MLRFGLHELNIGGRSYLLLPKLNSGQMGMLTERLRGLGYTIRQGTPLTAKSGSDTLRLDPSGLAWSRADPGDSLIPAIPGLLGFPKEAIPLGQMMKLYFSLRVSGPAATIRFRPRLEGGSLWKKLRAAGSCALAPDESVVLRFLLDHCSGKVSLVSDFPASRASVRVINGRQFFEAKLSAPVVRSTLAGVEGQGARNSYLPQQGSLRLTSFSAPSRKEFAELFESLGEWCCYRSA